MRQLAVVLLGLVLGCSGGELPRVPVYGHVAFRGCPIRGGIIVFTPDKERGTIGNGCQSPLGPDGTFRLPEGGLPPGWYRVTLASHESYVPPRYRDPDLANIVREVIAGRENSFAIYLDD